MKKLIAVSALLGLLLPSIVFGATFTRNLSYGTTGTDVSWLQQFLTDESLYTGPITATFGPLTRNGVIAFQEQKGITPAVGYFGPITRADAEAILANNPSWVTNLSNGNSYSNVNGNTVESPAYSSSGIPAGATAQCRDGTYSFSLHHSGTCSHHGGVAQWLQ
jgi:peptidoglycan hydrolase-like protein with peptidoglycan-binding domain